MKVVFLSAAYDLAGAGYALKAAFDEAPGWEARAVCRNESYLKYPTDVVWRGMGRAGRNEVAAIVNDADIVHAMNSHKPLSWFRLPDDKVRVVHHLGTTYRRNPEAGSAMAQRYGAIEVTDSIDLLRTGIGWLPIPADLEALESLRARSVERAAPPDRPLRIAHAPTNRAFKDTRLIMETLARLAKRYPLEIDLIEHRSNRECLARKARADIFVDQLKYGFGLNAIECWAMGIPVVSGLTIRPEAKAVAEQLFGFLPWVDADECNLERTIEALIVEPDLRAMFGRQGRRHAERWHSQTSVVQQATTIYNEARELVA